MTECRIRLNEAVVVLDDGTTIRIPRASTDSPEKTARSIGAIVHIDVFRYELILHRTESHPRTVAA